MSHPVTDCLARPNAGQREATETPDRSPLVLAGTGKTRVPAARCRHFLRTGRAGPGQILAIIFANKAASEMCERIAAIPGRPGAVARHIPHGMRAYAAPSRLLDRTVGKLYSPELPRSGPPLEAGREHVHVAAKRRAPGANGADPALKGPRNPGQVLAVTSTNKAAREMRERFGAILGRPAQRLWFGTFYSLCVYMPRQLSSQIELSGNFTIPDTDDHPPFEAGHGGRAGGRQALGTPGADGADPALEGSRPDPGPHPPRRGHRFRRRPRPSALHRRPGTPDPTSVSRP